MKIPDQKIILHSIKEWSRHHRILSISSIILIIIIIYFLSKPSPSKPFKLVLDYSIESEVLLLYVYANTHSHAYDNLKYFIEKAVRQSDGVDYYFILQQVDNKMINETTLPSLNNTNAHYIQHENKCFDFGTYGWFLNEFTYGNPWTNSKRSRKAKIDLKRYKYFIFMNSSIRGPFFTPYFIQLVLQTRKNYYWYSIFTRRINQHTKLVGCTISCEATPHVQTYIFATDFTGLSLLLKPGETPNDGIFTCYGSKDLVSAKSEVPTSNRIISSGYLIDSLLTKYQKVNFSDPSNRFCNANQNPYKDKSFDGTSLEPFEVVFVKYSDYEFAKEAKEKAIIIQRWMRDTKSFNRTIW